MKLSLYQVDAFTSRLFAGNPAAVCPLDTWLDERLMQAIAAENNLAETAFFAREEDAYRLRWFTPSVEVDLCGHATLAAAFVVFRFLEPELQRVAFDTRSGRLWVIREEDRLTLDFPARPHGLPLDPALVAEGLGLEPLELYDGPYWMAAVETEEQVRGLAPRFDALAGTVPDALIVTAPGAGCDFVSRFFAPNYGIPEDPVTGSAHCTLAPYWARRLGRGDLFARQISPRGGEIWCRDRGDRVLLSGQAALYLRGELEL
jgi:PhzF family phenazine biosynthesis protein